MLISPYATTACRGYRIDDLKKEIRRATMSGDNRHSILTPSGKNVISSIVGVTSDSPNIPLFTHPMPFLIDPTDTTQLFDYIAIDIRATTRIDRGGELKIINESEYEFQLMRGLLMAVARLEGGNPLLSLGELPPIVFVNWLSQVITRRLGLTPAEQVKIKIVTMFYWQSLFHDVEKDAFDEGEKRRVVTKLNSMTQIPSTLSFEISDRAKPMYSLENYTAGLVELIDTPRINSLTPGLLLSMLGGSWFGGNVKETVAVALEHPPTFLAMIHQALKERSYRKSQIGSLVYDNDKRNRGREFQINLNHLLVGEFIDE